MCLTNVANQCLPSAAPLDSISDKMKRTARQWHGWHNVGTENIYSSSKPRHLCQEVLRGLYWQYFWGESSVHSIKYSCLQCLCNQYLFYTTLCDTLCFNLMHILVTLSIFSRVSGCYLSGDAGKNGLTHWGRDKKWTPFCRRHVQVHFLEWKCLNSDWNFTEVCS